MSLRKLFPLSSSQMLMYYQMTFSLRKSITNICTMMYFDNEVDQNLLMQAIYIAICRNKSSFTRLYKSDKKIMQYFSEQSPDKIISYDYTNATEDELENDIMKWSSTPFPNNAFDTQLYRVYLIKCPNEKYAIYFCVSHLAFDAYSLMTMASDIINCYKALLSGEKLPNLKADPLGAMEADNAYLGSEKHSRDRKYWEELYKEEGEPLYTSFNKYGSKEYTGKKTTSDRQGRTMYLFRDKGRYFKKRLDKSIVEKVLATAKQIGVSPQIIYLLAVRSYLAKMRNNCDDVTVINTIARRATLAQKRSGGTRVVGLDFRMKFDNELSFKDACIEMNNKHNAFFNHCNFPVMEQAGIVSKMYKVPAQYGYHSINTTYQPYFVAIDESVPVHFDFFSNGGTSVSCYLTMMALDNSGDLVFNYDYQPLFYNEETLEKVHSHITKFLIKATDNHDIKISELMSL